MSDNEVIIGNLTTIIMFLFSACGGGAIINSLGGTSQVAIVVGAIVGLAYSLLNAYYPNFFKFLNNNRENIQTIADCVSHDECKCKKVVEEKLELVKEEPVDEEIVEEEVVEEEIIEDEV